MFENLRKKTKTILNWEKKSKIDFFLVLQFHFCPLHLISPNLHIILKKKLHAQEDLKEALQFLK